jgi:hypothetical protein
MLAAVEAEEERFHNARAPLASVGAVSGASLTQHHTGVSSGLTQNPSLNRRRLDPARATRAVLLQ